jgi:hypothetical protein
MQLLVSSTNIRLKLASHADNRNEEIYVSRVSIAVTWSPMMYLISILSTFKNIQPSNLFIYRQGSTKPTLLVRK